MSPSEGWRAQASCHPDNRWPNMTRAQWTALWYPEQGGDCDTPRLICAGCPVKADCCAEAVATGEQMGTWGGLSIRQRRRLNPRIPKKREAVPVVAPSKIRGGHGSAQHGTRSKYTGGCRCDPCRAAEAAYTRQRVADGRKQTRRGAA
jgi:hypothetical protein